MKRKKEKERKGAKMGEPYKACERYTAGGLTRDGLVDLLVNWDYEPLPPPTKDIFDDLRFSVDGSFHDVEKALRHGLIDDDLYEEVCDRREEMFKKKQQKGDTK